MKITIDYEGNFFDLEMSSQATIKDLKNDISNIVGEDEEDLDLSRMDVEEVWPCNDTLPLQMNGRGLRDGETLILALPKAGESNVIVKFANATDEYLKVNYHYMTRDVNKTNDITSNIKANSNPKELWNVGGGFEVKSPPREYVNEEKKGEVDLDPHIIRKIPLHNHLYDGVMDVRIFRTHKLEKTLKMKPGDSMIISPKPNSTGLIAEDSKKSKIWGINEWMPENGASKDPHATLSEGMRCQVCGTIKLSRHGQPSSFSTLSVLLAVSLVLLAIGHHLHTHQD